MAPGTDTGGRVVTAGRGEGPGPGPGPGLGTGEIAATAGTADPPGGRGATPETADLDLRAAVDLADNYRAELLQHRNSKYFRKYSPIKTYLCRLVCAELY